MGAATSDSDIACYAVAKITGISLLKFHRAFGLTAFFCVIFHLTVWLVLDKQFYWGEIIKDLTKRSYIIIGMLAFALPVPLAITSKTCLFGDSVRETGADYIS